MLRLAAEEEQAGGGGRRSILNDWGFCLTRVTDCNGIRGIGETDSSRIYYVVNSSRLTPAFFETTYWELVSDHVCITGRVA